MPPMPSMLVNLLLDDIFYKHRLLDLSSYIVNPIQYSQFHLDPCEVHP